MRKIILQGNIAKVEGNIIHATGILFKNSVAVDETCTATAPDGCVYRGKVVRVDPDTQTYDADIDLTERVEDPEGATV